MRCSFKSCAYIRISHTVNQSHCFGLPLSEQRCDLRTAAIQQVLKTAQRTVQLEKRKSLLSIVLTNYSTSTPAFDNLHINNYLKTTTEDNGRTLVYILYHNTEGFN